jgi:hypothetical protein
VARACEDREEWYEDKILMIAEAAPAGPRREMERRVGGLKRQLVRLRNRPRKALLPQTRKDARTPGSPLSRG